MLRATRSGLVVESSDPLRQPTRRIAVSAGKATLVLCVVLLPIALHAGVSYGAALLFAAAIAASCIPEGLLAQAYWQRRGRYRPGPAGMAAQRRSNTPSSRLVILISLTGCAAELVATLAGLAALAIWHIPIALGIMEILAIDLLAELFPIAVLSRDKPDGKPMHEQSHGLHHHVLDKRSLLDVAWCGLLIGGFAFLNFLLYFWRRGLSAEHISSGSHIQMQATALTFLTIVLCQLADILQRRSVGGLFTRYQLHNRQLWLAMGLSLFCVLNIVYDPWIAPYFQAGSLGFVDWLFALLAVALFVAVREFQRHTHNHSRTALFARHGHETVRKHLHKQTI